MTNKLKMHVFHHQEMGRQAEEEGKLHALSMKEVSFSYGKKPFIKDLSLALPEGRVTSIIGPNGCGKSTVFKLFSGILKAQAGSVKLEGLPLSHLTANQRARRLALLSQGAKVPAMSVESLVACGRYPYKNAASHSPKSDAEHIEEAMRLAGVLHHRGADVRFLSGGERQRAFIAMTLAQDTSLIILDEPTTYLDVRACHEIMELLCSLNEEHEKTIVTIIHDIDLALRYSHNITVMKEGAVVCSAGAKDAQVLSSIEESFRVKVYKNQIEGKESFTLFSV